MRKIDESIETENALVVVWGKVQVVFLFLFFLDGENVLELDSSDGCTAL